MSDPRPSNRDELIVLSLIGLGLLAVLFAIIAGLFGWFRSTVQPELPNWAENVLVSIATASALKLGDVLAVLAALAAGRQAGRQTETLAKSLGESVPAAPTIALPPDAAAAAAAGAQQATAAAGAVADDLAQDAAPADPGNDEGKAP